jgi:hypothetical protein
MLTSQRFWDHMSYLDADKIAAIEQDLTRCLIDQFQIEMSCLFSGRKLPAWSSTFSNQTRIRQNEN